MSTSVSTDEGLQEAEVSEENLALPDPPTAEQSADAKTFKAALGWTFFDPANLLCILLLTGAGVLSFTEMQMVGQSLMVVFYYICMAAFLRGYFYFYYYGGRFGRVVVYLLLFVSILMGAAFWEDASLGFHYLGDGAKKLKQPSQALHWSALLHCMAAICLTVHLLIPRRWLIRMTDDIVERVPEK